ncbi:hypothetical protein rosag_47720 [Roseisolibacter agri]|uniref:UDP-N-acetylglucosamine kinase n=1 Tax=Roseisolibacter agri TaxID=2014610 RepID=A0AA37VGB7_9BACT|nr:hypothetical protein rosag_47720 [Roseisolibacter agri]
MTSRPADGLPAPGAGEPIRVFAGVNGAGKSSVPGATFRQAGLDYFNPDEAAQALIADAPSFSPLEANARAWRIGYDRLRQAADMGGAFAFETTLGGETITRELQRATGLGRPVDLWYVGLDSAERHIARVRARVARGGPTSRRRRSASATCGARRTSAGSCPACGALPCSTTVPRSTPSRAPWRPRLPSSACTRAA